MDSPRRDIPTEYLPDMFSFMESNTKWYLPKNIKVRWRRKKHIAIMFKDWKFLFGSNK